MLAIRWYLNLATILQVMYFSPSFRSLVFPSGQRVATICFTEWVACGRSRVSLGQWGGARGCGAAFAVAGTALQGKDPPLCTAGAQ